MWQTETLRGLAGSPVHYRCKFLSEENFIQSAAVAHLRDSQMTTPQHQPHLDTCHQDLTMSDRNIFLIQQSLIRTVCYIILECLVSILVQSRVPHSQIKACRKESLTNAINASYPGLSTPVLWEFQCTITMHNYVLTFLNHGKFTTQKSKQCIYGVTKTTASILRLLSYWSLGVQPVQSNIVKIQIMQQTSCPTVCDIA